MFRLIMGRVAWMDEVGIRQWNITKYDECYPPEYYAEHAAAGRIFCLEDAEFAVGRAGRTGDADCAGNANRADGADCADGRIVAVGLLLEEDERWPDSSSADAPDSDGMPGKDETGRGVPAADAYYLHHFATAVGAPKGVGGTFLEELERYAAEQGKAWFRLDSADDNETLEAYYTSRGYEPAGTCVDGLYTGILRQKKLR